MYYFLILSMVVIVSWAIMLNIAKVIIDRMDLQNKADALALSIATDRARVMNIVAGLNYLIGITIDLGNYPFGVLTPTYDVAQIGPYWKGSNTAATKLYNVVTAIKTAQDAMIYGHVAYVGVQMASLFSDKYLPIVTPLPTGASSFGLERNKRKAKFIKAGTVNLGVKFYYPSSTLKTLNETWFVSTDNIYKQKVKVRLTKLDNDKKTLYMPRLLDIDLPALRIAYSAAAIYNTKGTMFPTKSSNDSTGLPNGTVVAIIEALYIETMGETSKKIWDKFGNIPIVGPVIAGLLITTYITPSIAMHAYSFAVALGVEDSKNPMKSYINAKNGGWAAHLVPYSNN
ncbi:MAG: hypothetical protein LBV16_08680 [Elusimicrobiota bacterium]|nr:hypothetical protein [Elusimicrobiota bacterium]